MDSVIARMAILDEKNAVIESSKLEPSTLYGAVGGGGVCHIVPNNLSIANAKFSIMIRPAGDISADWDKPCILYKTKDSPQKLIIELDTHNMHTNGKPLFHFVRIETKQYALVKNIRCYYDSGLAKYVDGGYAMKFPDNTHTIEISFGMSTQYGTVTLPFDIDLFTTRLDNGEVKNHDPQVGNEPPKF